MMHKFMNILARYRDPVPTRAGLALAILMACAVEPASGSAEYVLKCVVSIPPLASVVENIGGARVSISVLINSGQNPHTFEPTPSQMKTLVDADILFTVGLPFESIIISCFHGPDNRLLICDTSRGSTLRQTNHFHQEKANGLEEIDRHIWLSPKNLASIALSIQSALTSADPGGAQSYHEETARFMQELEIVHRMNIELLSPMQGKAFTVFHPSFGYFADAYNLEQRAVETGGKPPTPRELVRLIAQSKIDDERVLFVQPQFDRKSAETIAASIGAEVRTLDPLARDVLANLATLGKEISRAMSSKATLTHAHRENHE